MRIAPFGVSVGAAGANANGVHNLIPANNGGGNGNGNGSSSPGAMAIVPHHPQQQATAQAAHAAQAAQAQQQQEAAAASNGNGAADNNGQNVAMAHGTTHNLIPGYVHAHAAALSNNNAVPVAQQAQAQAQAQAAIQAQAHAAAAQFQVQAQQHVQAQAQAQAQAQQVQAQQVQVALAAAAAAAAAQQAPVPSFPHPAAHPPHLILSDPRVSPPVGYLPVPAAAIPSASAFYGPALPPNAAIAPTSGAATAQAHAVPPTGSHPALPAPTAWRSLQVPSNPIPPNVPGLPDYGLPLHPMTGQPFQTLQDLMVAKGPGLAYLPTYNGINLNYPGVRMMSVPETGQMGGAGTLIPPIYAVDNFLTSDECDFLIAAAGDSFTPAPVVGQGAGEVSVSRTSSTVYLAREDLPLYLEKVCRLTGKPRDHCELPQVGRYFPTQQYMPHFDAFDLSNENGRRFAANGGQRTVTVLVYLNDVPKGGSTNFPALNLDVRPRKGMALVFFPATVDGLLDRNALHAALPAVDTKYVSQVWIRQGDYDGLPSKRIFPNEDVARRAAKSFRNGAVSSNVIEGLLTAQQQQEYMAAAVAAQAQQQQQQQVDQSQQQQLAEAVSNPGSASGNASAT